jgi:type I restriction enzyme M protein
MVFSKCRKEDDSVLFIDASKEFEKSKNQNILTDENIEKIVESYKEKKEIEKFSRLVSLKEIEDNDYNLNIPRYLDTFEKEEAIDLESLAEEIKKLEIEEIAVDKEIDGYCKELGIEPPFKINEVR